ncbi:unnamed protein product, partial [Didymodactylos carnosus]
MSGLKVFFDWHSLIDNQVDRTDLAHNIRQIYVLKARDPPEVTLSVSDENQVLSACRRAVEPQLAELFQSIGATDKLLSLVLNYITTVNDLAVSIRDQTQLNNIKFGTAILQKLTSKLELRSEFLSRDWPVTDDNNDSLLDTICYKYPTMSSFRALSYEKIKSEYLKSGTDIQNEILEKVWIDGNNVRTKIKQYNLPLSVAAALEERGISQLEDLTEDDVKKLIRLDHNEVKQRLSSANNNIAKINAINDKHDKFKANLTRLLKQEGRAGKQDAIQHEKELTKKQERTKEAIKNVQDLTENLKKNVGNNKDQLEKHLSDIASKLHVNWRFSEDELNKPDMLLNSILKELNTVNTQFNSTAAYKSDEDIVEHINGGIVLYGIQLTNPDRLGEKAQRPLLSRPAYCPLLSPSLMFESTQQKFTSLEASNQFTQTIKTSGLTVAAHLEASGWGVSVKASHAQGKKQNTTTFVQKKTQSTIAIQTDYTVVPIKCFRIPREEMKLSTEAENALAGVNTTQKAKEFLRQFHSHVSDGVQHIGGIFMRTVTVETQDETDVETLETMAAKTMSSTASVGASFGGFGGGAGVSVESFQVDAKKEGKETIKRTAKITRKIQCIGPPCYNSDLFVQALHSNNSSWYVIDRDSLSSFIPVWEIILKSYASQASLVEAAHLLKRVWLQEAENYDHVLLIQCEIQRVRFGDYTVGVKTPSLLSSSSNDAGKNDIDKLDAEIQNCLGDFDVYELTPSMLLNKVCSVFQLITVRSNICGYDLLPALLGRDSMKSFLKSIALCTDEAKIDHILSVLLNIFSAETLRQLYQKQIELEPEILRLIQKGNSNANDKKLQQDDIFSIPAVPLTELSSYLETLMTKKNKADFNSDAVSIISKSLRNAAGSGENLQKLEEIKNILISYGWSNDVDGFAAPLTDEGLEALFAAMDDVFRKKQKSTLSRQATLQSAMFSEYNSSVNQGKGNEKMLYSYTDWLVDRPIPPFSEPVSRFMDILRHRLKITPIGISASSTATTTSKPQTAKVWGKKKAANPPSVPNDTSTALPAPTASSPVQTSQYSTIYDILIHILNYSDLLSQIELFRLLIERRTAAPLLIPALDSGRQPYNYLINALSFVTTKLSGQREYDLSTDCSLLRIAIISMRSLKHSESSDWLKQVFSSLSLSSPAITCIQSDQCIAEIAVGFIPCSVEDIKKNEKHREVLVLNVIGSYLAIWPYIQQFADVIMAEEDPSIDGGFQPVTPLSDNCNVITWKNASVQAEPYVTDDNYLHLSSSIIQSVNDIQSSLAELLEEREIDTPRPSLKSMVHTELYNTVQINLIDSESTVSKQDYTKVRVKELKLQQMFVKEAEQVALKNNNKSNNAEQQRIQRIIEDCRDQRIQNAYEVEKHPLIKCFTGILSLDNRQLRTLCVHQFIQQIDMHSRSAMRELINKKDEAFNEYDRDQQNLSYFEAKRLYASSALGIEHLWREICHLYASNPRRYEKYPALAAQHLIDGFALELLDGDAGMLEQNWIKAVFAQIEEQLMKERSPDMANRPTRIFILSILGVQSTGKSTLLNLMFGTRLRTSAGMCTRGVNIQLLKVENRPEYDYILILDTEGIRAPEHTGLKDSTWRDNRMATFAVLPADATIILINSEDDSAAREVLPIVMLAYQQSELAASSTSQLSARVFFVYTRVDMNDTKKLVNNIQAMFIDLKNNAEKLQQGGGNPNEQKTNRVLFRDFRVKAEDGEVGGKESDIKFLGKVKKSDIPPDDVPDTDYGEAIVQLNEYIYNRLVSNNSDGQKWKARELKSFAPYLDSIWQCILSVDFTLSFKSVVERWAYDELQIYCAKQRTKLANLYSSKYDEIEEKILAENIPDKPEKMNEKAESDLCKSKIDQYQAELSKLVDTRATEIDKEVLNDLKAE